ncbi:hypothetical protein SS1G_08196 [Sclerotinia sclerotiorum 1980 UF-70]|uniref:LYR motif-containing protein Cup1-like N-terminal domain-containing protein n=2 Tax=Sclerotinia sclerotiorum (strain ATCC 18683 / 1980 / Ss-1) TaxID=665079 RepID=A7ES91_SCLS1|nr:hypothetical protein SS1G_08196 [Sclerotinia sclerotiorum 1980 UF-70]APA12769.1 hypothetical protein sscle_10g075390 [Sclerotinia sclerotiorum 1980 UF-70]EDN92333.1 hypothetical protein SS1G_08196 [Sclerotinia sclerotiorum 1980 UF-70]
MPSAPKAAYEVSQEVRQYLPTFRQKYRALLREATYLPDSAARTFVHDQIVNRYNPPNPKKLNPKFWGTDFFRSKVDLNKLESRSKKTTQKLHLLERVNLEGSSKDLQHVLLRTYGRAGVRRRELLSQLLRPGEEEVPQDDTALSQIIDNQIAKKLDATRDVDIDKALDVSKRQRREHKEIALFIASQQATSPMESMRGRIKKIKPDIPLTNAWGRKLPVKRKANMLRTWWANLLERVLPPLPEHEWNRLRDLAEGIQPIEYAPPRRKPAILRNLDTSDESIGREMNSLYNEPARLHANFWAKSTEKARSETPETPDDVKHNSTRARRRMYRMIWSLSSKMVQDESTREYKITWGGQRSPAAAGEITKPSLKDNEFFEMPKDGLA